MERHDEKSTTHQHREYTKTQPSKEIRLDETLVLLDFDLTLTAYHSRGAPYNNFLNGSFDFDSVNIATITKYFKDWMDAGIIIVILSRCVDRQLAALFEYLRIDFTWAFFDCDKRTPRQPFCKTVWLMTPDVDLYGKEQSLEYWAGWKYTHALLACYKFQPKMVYFADDTPTTITKFQSVPDIEHPPFDCILAVPGAYESTLKILHAKIETTRMMNLPVCPVFLREKRCPFMLDTRHIQQYRHAATPLVKASAAPM
jgi:hypothetical protein